MTTEVQPVLIVTTNCRSCLAEIRVPVTVFERWTAVSCEHAGLECQGFNIASQWDLGL